MQFNLNFYKHQIRINELLIKGQFQCVMIYLKHLFKILSKLYINLKLKLNTTTVINFKKTFNKSKINKEVAQEYI